MATVPLTRSKHLIPFAAVLRKHGEPVGRLLRMAALPSTCLDDPEMLVPVAASTHFRELCARRTGSPNLALTVTEHLGIADLGGFGQALLRAPTLARSLSELCKLVGTQSSNLAIELRPQPGGYLSCSHRVLSELGRGEWHRALYTLTWMLKVVRLADATWSPSEIWVDSKAAPTRFEAIESLGAASRFEQHSTGFLVPASMLALPLTKTPATQPEADIKDEPLRLTSPAKTYAEAVQQMIRSYASDGWLSIEQASEVANTSVRTLQRRLAAEQTTYSSLIEHSRAEMAGELLERTDASIAEIANQLGYKHQGHFTRAFYRWAEIPPKEFRRQRRPT